MTKHTQYLPQYTLDQLSERICIQLEGFKAVLNTNNMWDGITELCIKIENEPRAVNSVIAEAKQNHSQVLGSVYMYNTVLTRVYILLYYRHCDDTIYENVVFSQLIRAMGYYAKKNPLTDLIQPTIKNIIELDKLVEKAREEQKEKDVEPLFAFKALSRPEMDRLFDEYSEELLFLNLSGVIKELSDKYQTHLDEAEVWYNAKMVVHTLRDLHRPELFIKRAAISLVRGQIYNGYQGSQIILICVYAMVRSAKDNTHFAKFIIAMEKIANDDYSDIDMGVLSNIRPIKNFLDKEQPFDDYDYIGDSPNQTEVFTRADFDRALADYKARVQELEKEKEELKSTSKDEDIKLLQARIKELEEEIERLRQERTESKVSGWIDWLDDDVFKSEINAEAVAEAIQNINSSQLSDNCYWYVVYRVLDKIHWLADKVTNKALLKWANVHFNYGWKGQRQFKFSDIDSNIKGRFY